MYADYDSFVPGRYFDNVNKICVMNSAGGYMYNKKNSLTYHHVCNKITNFIKKKKKNAE